jgi:hypothetical protein
MQISTRGGIRDTEQNAETVIPWGLPSEPHVVTTLTPLAKRDRASLNSSGETGIIKLQIYNIGLHIAKMRHFDYQWPIFDNLANDLTR